MPLSTPISTPLRASLAATPRITRTQSRNLFMKIIDTVSKPNRLKAEREIARHIERNGGQLTDQLERDLARLFCEGR